MPEHERLRLTDVPVMIGASLKLPRGGTISDFLPQIAHDSNAVSRPVIAHGQVYPVGYASNFRAQGDALICDIDPARGGIPPGAWHVVPDLLDEGKAAMRLHVTQLGLVRVVPYTENHPHVTVPRSLRWCRSCQEGDCAKCAGQTCLHGDDDPACQLSALTPRQAP
jgi:hypothetical protein